MKLKVNNLVTFCTILLLNNRKKHGYEILKDLEKILGRRISASHVYPFLKSLEANHLVVSKRHGKQKRYSLTASGKRFVNNFFLKSSELVRLAASPSLSTCAHCSCRVFEGGVKSKDGRLIFCCSSCMKSFYGKNF